MAKESSKSGGGSAGTVPCAVLKDSFFGKHDEIIDLPKELALEAEREGYVDTHPNAIKAIRAAKEKP